MRSTRCPSSASRRACFDLLVVEAVRRVGICHGVLEGTDRHVGPLRHEEQLRALPDQDFPLAPRPEARDGADERALPGAGFADDEHALAAIDAHLRLAHHGGAVVEVHREPAQFERNLRALFGAHDVPRSRLFGSLQTVERYDQARDTVGGCGPIGKSRIILHQPVEGLLDGDKRRCGLHDFTERHRAGEIFRRAENNRNHRREDEIAVGNHRGAKILPHRVRAIARSRCQARR